MSNAFSYLQEMMLNEKMSATERKIGEAKSLIKGAEEKIKANEEILNKSADKKSAVAQKAQKSIDYWKELIANNEARLKELGRGVDTFKDHDPDELERKFTSEKEQKKHSENFSKMSDDEIKNHLDDFQKKVDDMDDEERPQLKNDPEYKALRKELKKRGAGKVELKKAKAKATETVPQPSSTDKSKQDPSKPTENPDRPNLPDPPANMTDGDDTNGGAEELPTDEQGWQDYKKKLENERGVIKNKHFKNWSGDELKKGVDPKQAEADEKAYDLAAKKSVQADLAYNKWRDDVSKEKAKDRLKIDMEPKATPKEEPKATPKEEPKATTKEMPKKEIPKEEPKAAAKETPKEEQKEDKLSYKGSNKSHPLNFKDVEEYKQHHRDGASKSAHPTEYGDAVKHIKKVNTEIGELNDEIDLNNEELNDPKISKENKEAIKNRNKEIAKQIKDLHNSKKSHEKIVNKHEQDLSSDFYEKHSKTKELSDKIDDVVKNYREAEQSGETDKMKKLGSDFEELHSELKNHLNDTGKKNEPESDIEDAEIVHDTDDNISDWEDEEGDSYSRSLAKETGYKENKFTKEGTPKKVAKEVGKKALWLLNRLGSGLSVQDSSISDIVKNSPSRQALVSNYERLSDWRKERILKKIKKPLENHLRDMDDAIEDAEREVEKYETKENLTDSEKNKLRVAKKQLSALHKEQRSAQDTYDKIIKSGDTAPRKRGVVNVDVEDDEDNSNDTEEYDVERLPNKDDENNNVDSVDYLKKLSKSSDDLKSNDELQKAITLAKSEIGRLNSYDSSEAEDSKKSLEGAIEMGEKALKTKDGIGYALKALNDSYKKSKIIKESFLFLKTKTNTINIIKESEEIVEEKIDPSEYLKKIIRG